MIWYRNSLGDAEPDKSRPWQGKFPASNTPASSTLTTIIFIKKDQRIEPNILLYQFFTLEYCLMERYNSPALRIGEVEKSEHDWNHKNLILKGGINIGR